MDPRISRLTTVQQCDAFAKNALERGAPELAQQARERAVQIRAAGHGATNLVEIECLQAIYAYEEVLSQEHGRRTRAGRTWPMIQEKGIIPAVESIVTRREVSSGFTALEGMGLREYAFEAVVLRHPGSFSEEAVAISRRRMEAE